MASYNTTLTGIRNRRPPAVPEPVPVQVDSEGSVSAIIEVPVESLQPCARNARKHSDAQIDLIARSIKEFGFVNPILIDADNCVVAGHGRLEAAVRLGRATVPTVRLEHLTPTQLRAYRIADNRIAELSDWDDEILRLEIVDLSDLQVAGALDFDLTITGFETPALDLIIGGSADAEDLPAETVAEPDRTRPAVTQAGDLWCLGAHKILCGNSLEAASYARLMEGEVARMVFTDPPYNVPVRGHVRAGDGSGHREFLMASGEMSDAAFRVFLQTFLEWMVAVLQEGAIGMVCMDWRHIEDLIGAGKQSGLDLINLCVWNKTNGGMGSLYRSKHELICVFKKPGAAHVNNVELGKHGRYRTNVWDYAGVNSFGKGREADLADHPTVKPTDLVADAIMDVSHRGEIVLDAFGGSGSTLLAAEKTGRKARLIELDPLYVDVAIRRWQTLTGKQAVSAASGRSFSVLEAARTTEVGTQTEEIGHG